MNILMVDVGGTNIKLMASGHEGRRKVPSGPAMTAEEMVREVLHATEDWQYEAVTLGYPSLVADGKPAREPLNLGGGWLKFDYETAFQKPVRFINDAAMQALGSYEGGRMMFLGLGTSTGATVIVDDVIIPLEVGMMCLPSGARFIDRLTDARRQKDGRKKWLKSVYAAVEILQDVFKPDDMVLGGGNAKDVDPMPEGCRHRDNQQAFAGATRLWPGADMLVEPYGTSWRITKRKKPKAE
ncbi:MAG: hypothetical protein JWO89_2995 [Verrucomicrobiaceae bacterium]|nr:hypothetical protein [Verrucomicrobiaceae bacterium]MDB6118377.1 hypothetical protein [Verrucomicrobiaceae bacterium]